MKIVLALIICSGTAGTCLPPYTLPQTYSSTYECMMEGYKQSLDKMKEIGKEDVDKHKIYIKFHCGVDLRYPT